MADSYIYKTFTLDGDEEAVTGKITDLLTGNGYVRKGDSGTVRFFRYPSIRYSSKKPLTCISRLSLDVTGRNGVSHVTVGMTFTKIRRFTIALMLFVCVVVPCIVSYLKYGAGSLPDIPPMSYLGVPLGFMLHYHTRWRVFRAVKRLVESAGKNNNRRS